MLVELIIIACLEAEPTRCEEFRVPFQAEINIVQCVWQSHVFAAEWKASHPAWKLKRVSCAMPRA